jgi:hypothetical protein
MLPLAADEDLHGHIVNGLRRRQPDIDLVRVQDALPLGTADLAVLEWAATEGRVLVTQDHSTMVGFAWDRVNSGLPMPGVIVRGKGVSVRKAIDELLIIADCGIPEDFRGRVEFLPL